MIMSRDVGPAVSEVDVGELFEVERGRLFGTLVLLLGNRSDAEEVVQDAFANVLQKWRDGFVPTDPKAYLYRTAVNLARTYFRRKRVREKLVIFARTERDDIGQIDDRDAILRVVLALPRRQRAAVVLTELLGYSAGDAGRAMGVRPSTVRALSSQARATLRQNAGRLL